MTTASLPEDTGGRWCSPIDPTRYERSPALSEAERHAIRELGLRNLRRLRYHDPDAPQWAAISRLLHPLQDVNAGFDTLPTMHLRRAMNDAVAVLLLRCADSGRSYWGWTEKEWLDLLGRNHKAFRGQVPDWAEGAVRPFLCGHAYHLGGFASFNRLGRFDRLTLACRIFGSRLVEEEVGRVRAVLTGWGYQYGREHDQGVPSVMSQLSLLNRSPHARDLATSFFDRVRREDLLTDGGTRSCSRCNGPLPPWASATLRPWARPPKWSATRGCHRSGPSGWSAGTARRP